MKFHTIPINAGEFLARTGGMSASDFGAHARLYIRHFQIGERGLLDDDRELARVCGLSTRTFQKSKASILRGFINKRDDNGSFWIMPEVILELKNAQQKSEKNKANSLKRWENNEPNALPTQCDGNAIQHPISNKKHNDKDNIIIPSPRKQMANKSTQAIQPNDVCNSVWEDFLQHRKVKNAPVTETVLKSIRSEADKVGWQLEKALAEVCSRGWQGFKADWILRDRDGVKLSQNMKNLKDLYENGW